MSTQAVIGYNMPPGYSVLCFNKQALISADKADRVLGIEETRAIIASVKICSSHSESHGPLRADVIRCNGEAESLG